MSYLHNTVIVSEKGVANGVATLDSSGDVPIGQIISHASSHDADGSDPIDFAANGVVASPPSQKISTSNIYSFPQITKDYSTTSSSERTFNLTGLVGTGAITIRRIYSPAVGVVDIIANDSSNTFMISSYDSGVTWASKVICPYMSNAKVHIVADYYVIRGDTTAAYECSSWGRGTWTSYDAPSQIVTSTKSALWRYTQWTLYKSTDRGRTWDAGVPYVLSGGSPTLLGIMEFKNGNLIAMATSSTPDYYLTISTNGGTSFSNMDTATYGLPIGGPLGAINLGETSAIIIIRTGTTTNGTVWYTSDSGLTWTQIDTVSSISYGSYTIDTRIQHPSGSGFTTMGTGGDYYSVKNFTEQDNISFTNNLQTAYVTDSIVVRGISSSVGVANYLVSNLISQSISPDGDGILYVNSTTQLDSVTGKFNSVILNPSSAITLTINTLMKFPNKDLTIKLLSNQVVTIITPDGNLIEDSTSFQMTSAGDSVTLVPTIHGKWRIISSEHKTNVRVIAFTGNILQTDDILMVDSSSAKTLTLLTAELKLGRTYIVKDYIGNANAENITIATQGSELIDGASTAVINQNYGVSTVVSDGTNWFTI